MMNLDSLLVKGIFIIAAGGISIKTIKAVRQYKIDKDSYEEIEESSKNEK